MTLKTFKQTSDEPYLRHDYKLIYTDGHSVVFDNYEDLSCTWFNAPSFLLDYVEVLDYVSSKKGFGF